AAARARLQLLLGTARDRSDDRAGARDACRAAAALAREARDPQLLAEAALGFKGLGLALVGSDAETVALLREALAAPQAALGEPLRARLLAALALELYYDAPAESQRLSAQAVARAREAGEPGALAQTLSARHAALWSAGRAHERLGVADEMHALARGAHDRIAALQARNWRVIDLLELGRVRDAEREVDVYAAEAAELRLPRYRWYVPLWRAAIAILRGDFAAAETASAEAQRLGVQAQDANAARYGATQHAILLAEQMRYREIDVDELMRLMHGAPTSTGAWLPWIVWIQAERGEASAARAGWEQVAADDFAMLPDDANWDAATDAAEACATLGDADRAPALIARLEPYADVMPVIGRGIAVCAPVSYFLGRLRLTAGDPVAAAASFSAAHAACARVGAAPRAARSRLGL
ncbi:hypothetical protein VSS74_31445, partial [Conexibacter stalactiti]